LRIRLTIAEIEARLAAVGSPERASGEKRYLKSDLEFLGVSVPVIRKQARLWLRSRPDVPHDQLIRLVKALWRRRTHELRSFGLELLVACRDLLLASDLELVEWILRRANTWAHVDPVAVQVAGHLVVAYPRSTNVIDRWAEDPELWVRRAALLALLLPLRRGDGDWQRFTRYAEGMLEEKEFFIRKAIGWVLREAGQATPVRVTEFVTAHIATISGVTIREAVRHLEPDDRERLMADYSSR